MGKGNPESADAVLARGSKVFVADKLSDLNKRELTKRDILWVELRDAKDFQQFERVLRELSIPFKPFKGNLSKSINRVLERVFEEESPSDLFATVREQQSEYWVDLVDESEEVSGM